MDLKLGKILDLTKCYHDGKHWTHPDLKEDVEYIVRHEEKDLWLIGTFTHFGPPYATFWSFSPNFGCVTVQLSYGKHPMEEGWQFIQEILGEK